VGVKNAVPGYAQTRPILPAGQPGWAGRKRRVNSLKARLYMDGLYMDGLYMDGLYMDGLYMDGLYMDGLYMDGLYMDGLYVDGLYMDGLYMDGLYVDGPEPGGSLPLVAGLALGALDAQQPVVVERQVAVARGDGCATAQAPVGFLVFVFRVHIVPSTLGRRPWTGKSGWPATAQHWAGLHASDELALKSPCCP
jgi:hypothetical protein